MVVIIHIYEVLQIILYLFLGIATLYIFIFALAGLFYRQPPYPAAAAFSRIAVLIPGYKEDNVILEAASKALEQDYPKTSYDVVIIADSFRQETLSALRSLPLVLVEVQFEKSTKAKALNKAMDEISADYDLAVVLDADNIMAPDFLDKVNRLFHQDFVAVQGHRAAKNMNTSLAVLDAVSEEINNHIFRKGHRALGLSSAIIGSGMAFRYGYFKSMMAGATAVGGFDKEIELKMLKEGRTIAYMDDALVFDEKVQKAEVFTNQRRRWLSAQFVYFRQDFLPALRDLFFKGNFDYFDKAFQFIQPPRILLLGAVILCSVFFPVINFLADIAQFPVYWWIGLAAACILAFLFSIPRSFYTLQTLKALGSLPGGMILMLGSLLKIRGANKQFIHTSHGSGDQKSAN